MKELRVAGANTLVQANEYLKQEFIPWKQHDLAAILSHVETRQVGNDYTIRFAAKVYQIERKAIWAGLRGAAVRLEQRRDGSLAVLFRDKASAPLKLHQRNMQCQCQGQGQNQK